ncbi:MAG TPA: RNA polymerase sigma factor [Candidatus Limnocylindrales bacterium]
MERATVERAMAGDHDAFARLATGSIRSMYATARLIVRNDAAAEDATQEALMNAWRHLPSLRDPDRFEAWLYRLLVNACRTQLRKPGSHDVVEIEVVDRSRDGGDPSGRLVDRDQLERGFRRLDADQRAVLILHLYRGYTVPEVAEMVGIPVGTAKSRIHRATNVLRAALEADARPIIAIEASRP